MDEQSSRLNTSAQAAAAEAEDNRHAVIDALVAGALTRAEIVLATGISRATVGRALTHWATTGAITKTTDGRWALTHQAKDAA